MNPHSNNYSTNTENSNGRSTHSLTTGREVGGVKTRVVRGVLMLMLVLAQKPYRTEPQIGREGDFAFKGERFASLVLLNQTCSEGMLQFLV